MAFVESVHQIKNVERKVQLEIYALITIVQSVEMVLIVDINNGHAKVMEPAQYAFIKLQSLMFIEQINGLQKNYKIFYKEKK